MMLTRKQSQVVFVLLIVTALTGVVALAVTFERFGFDHSVGYFVGRWLKAWVIGVVVGLPFSLFTFPILRKFVDSLTA